jgi:hypothetical protein
MLSRFYPGSSDRALQPTDSRISSTGKRRGAASRLPRRRRISDMDGRRLDSPFGGDGWWWPAALRHRRGDGPGRPKPGLRLVAPGGHCAHQGPEGPRRNGGVRAARRPRRGACHHEANRTTATGCLEVRVARFAALSVIRRWSCSWCGHGQEFPVPEFQVPSKDPSSESRSRTWELGTWNSKLGTLYMRSLGRRPPA